MDCIATNIDRRTLSASSLIGDKVVNMDGQKLGDVKGLMLDLERGQVAYAVLETGDMLGVGGKLFATPWNTLKVDGDDKSLVLNASKEQFKNAEGFDENNRPDFANIEFSAPTGRLGNTSPSLNIRIPAIVRTARAEIYLTRTG